MASQALVTPGNGTVTGKIDSLLIAAERDRLLNWLLGVEPLTSWWRCFSADTARVDSERTRSMLLIELAIAAVIWTPANVFACKWLADA